MHTFNKKYRSENYAYLKAEIEKYEDRNKDKNENSMD